MAFAPIETEDAFNAAIQERINRVHAKYADYDDLKKRAEQYDELISQGWEQKAKAYEKDLTKAQQAAAAAADERAKEKARADKAERDLTRYKVAAKHKLPSDLADRIKGDTEDEMDADAEALAKFMGSSAAAPPRFRPDPQADPHDKDAAKTAAYRELLDKLNQ